MDEDSTEATGLEVPMAALSEAALVGVIDAYVLQEGTDYGAAQYTLDQKRAHVLAQLKAGTAKLLYDPRTETCTILPNK